MTTHDLDSILETRLNADMAAFNARHPELSRTVTVQRLNRDLGNACGSGIPFSGDHLGTHAHRETTAYGDPGEEIRRERIHRADIDLWDLLAA